MTSSHSSSKCQQCIDWDVSETVNLEQIHNIAISHHLLIVFFFVPCTDIVFFIFLYQRWMYKVDKSRVNEFGFSGEMEEEVKKKAITSSDDGNAQLAIAETPSAEPKPEDDKKRD